MTGPAKVPSIGQRMGRALWWWALLWGVVLTSAAWLAVRHEMNELLDDTLSEAAHGMLAPLLQNTLNAVPRLPLQPQPQPQPQAAAPAPSTAADAGAASTEHRLMWQVVQHGAPSRVLQASQQAPTQPVFQSATAGYTDTAEWRVYGLPLAPGGPWLYVAHAQEERVETQLELALAVGLATLPMAVLALLWLRLRLRQELQPLQRLAQRLRAHDVPERGVLLGAPERSELGPIHLALEALTSRLQQRLVRERAFSAHAAHALRTPLAGIDAQLAVALREATPLQQPRLQRARTAAARLQRVVVALLALFRSSNEPQREALDLGGLLARTPLVGLQLHVQQDHVLAADADLVHAALMNLLDNALRHGAKQAWVSTAAAQVLRVSDDGPGVNAGQRQRLQQALDAGGDDAAPGLGLGLQLADLVARAHGGRLRLPESGGGFVAELQLPLPSVADVGDIADVSDSAASPAAPSNSSALLNLPP